MPNFLEPILIGAVSLPILAALLLWLVQWAYQKVTGNVFPWDTQAKVVIAAVFTVLVFLMWAVPDISPYIVGAVAFVYQLILSFKNAVAQGAKSLSALALK